MCDQRMQIIKQEKLKEMKKRVDIDEIYRALK